MVTGALLLYDLSKILTGGGSIVLSGWQLEHPEPVANPIRLAFSIGLEIGIPLCTLAVAAGVSSLLDRNRAGLFLLLWAIVPVVVLLAANLFYFTDPRYAFVTLPAWALLAALMIRRVFESLQQQKVLTTLGLVVLLVADAAAADALYFRTYRGNRLDWKGAFAVARERSRAGDAFVAGWPDFGPYYAGREVMPWSDFALAEIQPGRRYWFILDSERIWTNTAMKVWVEQNTELIDVRVLRTPREAWMRVYLYDPGRLTRD